MSDEERNKILEKKLPLIWWACRKWARSHDEVEDLVSQICVQALAHKGDLETHLSSKFIRARVVDARRAIIGHDDSGRHKILTNTLHYNFVDNVPSHAATLQEHEDPDDPDEDPELIAWLSETVDTGEPIRRWVEASKALGNLIPLWREQAERAELESAYWPHGGVKTRATTIQMKREIRAQALADAER